MQRRERHLGRARQVELVLGQRVDLLLGVGQEAGAVQRLLAHEHRRDDRLEALAAEQLERPAHERELEQHERALQVGEARARHARAGLHVDQAAEQLEVVAAGLARLADLAQHLVLLGRGRVGRVRARRRARPASCSSTVADLGLELLHLGGDAAHLLDRGRRVLARALGLGDLVARRVLRRRAAPRAAGRSSRRRASSASSSSSASAAPRRASAARTGSGSRRISFRSSTGPAGLLPVGLSRRRSSPSLLVAGVLRRGTRRPPRRPRPRRCSPA